MADEEQLPAKLRGKTWSTRSGDVTSAHLAAMLGAIAAGNARSNAFPHCSYDSDRRVDRATQLLRKAGLIEFAGGKWRLVEQRGALLS